MQLSIKLPLLFAATMAIVVAAALFGLYREHQAVTVYATTVQDKVASERAVAGMLYAFKVQVQEWKDTLLRGKDPAKLEKHWGGFEKQEKTVHDMADALLATLPAGDEKALIKAFSEAHANMGAGYRKGLEAFKAQGFDASVGDAAVAGVDREPSRLLAEATTMIAADSAEVAAQAASGARSAMVTSLVLMALALGAGVFIGVTSSRAIVRPIVLGADFAQAVSTGDLTQHIDATGRDELASLLQSLSAMQDNISRIVSSVRQNAESVATASAEIASGNNDLSARTEQQASALEEAAASMDELGSTVRQNAENAVHGNRLATDASGVADKGGLVVSQVVETMDGINESSQKIVDIIAVIDGIAFQTNILALNAAVEAARAGEQGRGFAVVASEVRTLAQRSAAAAKEIKALISASVERVDRGSTLVREAGSTMKEIVTSIGSVTSIMREIQVASSEQSSGVSQIGEAVTHLDRATQQNAALVEQSAAAAESLKGQAQALLQAVAVFKLRR